MLIFSDNICTEPCVSFILLKDFIQVLKLLILSYIFKRIRILSDLIHKTWPVHLPKKRKEKTTPPKKKKSISRYTVFSKCQMNLLQCIGICALPFIQS